MVDRAYKVTLAGRLSIRYYVIYCQNQYYIVDYFNPLKVSSYLYIFFPRKFYRFKLTPVTDINRLPLKPIPLVIKYWQTVDSLLAGIWLIALFLMFANNHLSKITSVLYFNSHPNLLIYSTILPYLFIYLLMTSLAAFSSFKEESDSPMRMEHIVSDFKEKMKLFVIFPVIRLFGIIACYIFAINLPNILVTLPIVYAALPLYCLWPLLNIIQILEEHKFVIRKENL